MEISALTSMPLSLSFSACACPCDLKPMTAQTLLCRSNRSASSGTIRIPAVRISGDLNDQAVALLFARIALVC